MNDKDFGARESQKMRGEQSDDLLRKLGRLMEKWKDRLTLDNLRLTERYIVGELDFFILLRRTVDPIHADFCAVFKYHRPRSGNAFDGCDIEEFRDNVPYLRVLHDRMVKSGTEFDSVNTEAHDKQEAVLIDVVKLLDFPQRIVPALVRLDTLNDAFRSRADSLYFSQRLGFV